MDRLDRSLGISAVNHYHERGQQDCCFAEIKGENEHRACQGIADKAVQPRVKEELCQPLKSLRVQQEEPILVLSHICY